MPIVTPTRRRWTLAEYYKLADQGWFHGQRVELIEGEIIRLPPMKNYHACAIGLAEIALEIAFGVGFWIRTQMPLHLKRRSAPEPDIAVVQGGPRDYVATGHPTTAQLLVEISDTTLSYDRNRKASLYARAGIADYWIVNLIDRQLEVHRNPMTDKSSRYGFRYADVLILGPTDHITPLAAPQTSILVGDLLP